MNIIRKENPELLKAAENMAWSNIHDGLFKDNLHQKTI